MYDSHRTRYWDCIDLNAQILERKRKNERGSKKEGRKTKSVREKKYAWREKERVIVSKQCENNRASARVSSTEMRREKKGGGRERKRERTQERKRKVKVKLRERKELGVIQGDQEIERASGGVICIKRYPWRYPYATPLSLTLFCRSSFAPADISFAAIFTNPCSLASISADDP